MKSEYGRSLIEMLGVLAIGGVMTAAAYGTYNMLRTSQIRNLAVSEMEQIARNTGDYSGVSVDYLVKSGAITETRAPIGGADWSVTGGLNGKTFSINLTNLSHSDCAFFATKKITWAKAVSVNGLETSGAESCLSAPKNLISIIVE